MLFAEILGDHRPIRDENRGATVEALLSELQASYREMKAALSVKAKLNLPDMRQIDDIQEPIIAGLAALRPGRELSAEEKAVIFKATEKIRFKVSEIEWPNGEVLSEKVEELSQILTTYKQYIETPELEAVAERIRLVGPKVTDLLTGRILDLRIFSLWSPRLIAAAALYGTALLPPPHLW
ncbi:hypothetical protein [Pseudogemmobacter bohemicus]|uniref:hypothetical protein n=1 Tax=Pseudogemmobacter bohemicus TaxID=2250708 RepID=UPI000DD32659|nr:hypothetical protein [Pseudogemmobacter bohemicus]